MKSASLSLTLLLALCTGALAQGPVVVVPHLVGWSQPLTGKLGQLTRQDVESNCKPAQNICSTGAVATKPEAGGTAYDPGRQAVWISNGSTLSLVSVRNCKVLCDTKPTRVGTAAITGLAYSPLNHRLYQMQSTTSYFSIQTYNTKACPPKPLAFCNNRYQGGVAAGLAYDAPRDLLYVCVSTEGGSTLAWAHKILVLRASNPCQVICSYSFKGCTSKLRPLGLWMIKGLAYNPCNGTLYATDGIYTQRIKVIKPLSCQFEMLDCCSRQLAGEYRGLAVIPGWGLTTRGGSPCFKAPCPSCPAMTNALSGGDPSLSNPDFAFELQTAPKNAAAFLAVSVGSCTVGLPYLCGRLYPQVGAGLLVFGPFSTGGATTCGGSARLPVTIPADPSVCGIPLCSQWAVFCSAGGVDGFGLTNAKQFTIAR